jgi:hypothetical protein
MVDDEGKSLPALAYACTGDLVEEIEGDIFDAPEGAVLIRTLTHIVAIIAYQGWIVLASPGM